MEPRDEMDLPEALDTEDGYGPADLSDAPEGEA